jgi:hypothetical protein
VRGVRPRAAPCIPAGTRSDRDGRNRPRSRTDFAMGLVTMAAARPARIRAAAVSIAASVDDALRGSGRPGTTETGTSLPDDRTGRAVSNSAAASSGAHSRSATASPSAPAACLAAAASPTSAKGESPAGRRASHAFKVSSGPMPAGSPWVRSRGKDGSIRAPFPTAYPTQARRYSD